MFLTNLAINVLLVGFIIVSPLMCLVIMMQRSKQEGLGAAFGGGITESVWGAQTSQVLVKTTVWLALLFFAFSIALARLNSHRAALLATGSTVQKELLAPVAPAKTTVPAVTNAAATPSLPATSPAPAESTKSATH